MKYNRLFIISLSLIYSSTVFSDMMEATNHTPNTTNPEIKTTLYSPHFLNSPVADKIVSDTYVKIDRDNNSLRMDKFLLSNLVDYLKKEGLTTEAENIDNTLVHTDQRNTHIEIKADNKKMKEALTRFFYSPYKPESEDIDFSMNRQEAVRFIMNNNETFRVKRTATPAIGLDKLNKIKNPFGANYAEDREEFNREVDKRAAKNSTIMRVEQRIDEEVQNLEQEDSQLKLSISELRFRTKEDLDNVYEITNKHDTQLNTQDKKITQNENNIATNAGISTSNKINIDKHDKDIAKNTTNITKNNKEIKQNIKDIETNKNNIHNNSSMISKNSETLDEHNIAIQKNEKEIIEHRSDIAKNETNIKENTKTIDYIQENIVNEVNINNVKLPLKGHLSHLYNEQSTGRSKFNTLKADFEHFKSDTTNRFYKVEKRANQGIASVAAMSNLPFTDSATFSTAIGVGNYRNATSLAWGMQYRINDNVKIRATTAWNESNSWVSAGGVGISW